MAQVTDRQNDSVSCSQVSLAIPQTGNTVLLTIPVAGLMDLAVQLACVGQDLDALLVEGRVHQDAAFFTIASAAGDFTSPVGFMLKASGSPVTLAAAASAWFLMDVRGLFEVRVSASSGNVAGSTLTGYARGRK